MVTKRLAENAEVGVDEKKKICTAAGDRDNNSLPSQVCDLLANAAVAPKVVFEVIAAERETRNPWGECYEFGDGDEEEVVERLTDERAAVESCTSRNISSLEEMCGSGSLEEYGDKDGKLDFSALFKAKYESPEKYLARLQADPAFGKACIAQFSTEELYDINEFFCSVIEDGDCVDVGYCFTNPRYYVNKVKFGRETSIVEETVSGAARDIARLVEQAAGLKVKGFEVVQAEKKVRNSWGECYEFGDRDEEEVVERLTDERAAVESCTSGNISSLEEMCGSGSLEEYGDKDGKLDFSALFKAKYESPEKYLARLQADPAFGKACIAQFSTEELYDINEFFCSVIEDGDCVDVGYYFTNPRYYVNEITVNKN